MGSPEPDQIGHSNWSQFESMWLQHGNVILKYITQRADKNAIDDVLQEIRIAVFKAEQIPAGRELSYLLGIARNKCANSLRGAYFRRRVNDEVIVGQAVAKELSPEQQSIQKARREYLVDQIEKLPPRFRSIVTAFYFDDKPYAQIAKENELNIGTVKSRLSRAKQLLRLLIEE